jgi:16S rRNA (guanine527-N7)-methyltransferase
VIAVPAAADRQLDVGLAQLNVALDAASRERLLRYLLLLQKWNRVYSLTAIRDPARMVSHHILDSLAIIPYLPGPTLVDVGTGAGLPGIPLAVARPDWTVTLLDSSHKKGAFLRQATMELGLENVEVVTARAEDWRPSVRLDVAVSRAFSDLAGFVQAARHLVVPGGILAAMKGIYPDEEIAQMPAGVRLEAVVPVKVPLLRAARHLVLLRVEAVQ